MTNCKLINKGENYTYSCDECETGYAITYLVTGTTTVFGSVTSTTESRCVKKLTSGDGAYCTILLKNDVNEYQCSTSSICFDGK